MHIYCYRLKVSGRKRTRNVRLWQNVPEALRCPDKSNSQHEPAALVQRVLFICVVSSLLGTNGCREAVWLVVQSRGDFLFSAWAACFRAFLSTSLGKRLLVLVGPSQMGMAPRWCIKSDNGHCQVRQSCWCSMSAAEFSGLSWMIKLFWTAILCYRKASCAMFSRAGCRPSTYGWRSSCAGTCWLTGCPTGKSREQLYALLFDKAARGSQKNGSNAKSGCYTSKAKVHHWFRTYKAFYKLSGARKKLLVLK